MSLTAWERRSGHAPSDAAYIPAMLEGDLQRALAETAPGWLQALVRATRTTPCHEPGGRRLPCVICGHSYDRPAGARAVVRWLAQSPCGPDWGAWVSANPVRPHSSACDAAAWGMAQVLAGGLWSELPQAPRDSSCAAPVQERIGQS
ncbi:MAG TPA: hypothetical protein VMW47_05475 [Verrucomicrobiae bacterium]|nr:hypothetical protein [Verrucomicrobiae bacterium]